MITLYSGTPGSGKSLHAAYRIIYWLEHGIPVIANFPIDLTYFNRGVFHNKPPKKPVLFTYLPDFEITVPYLMKYAKEHHKPGKEGQTVVVIDECSILFNSREYGRKDRMQWIKFLQCHRHYGYNFVLITQNDRLIDRQIRSFIEIEYKHRNAKNFKFIGHVLSLIFGGFFVAVEMWYGMRLKCSHQFFVLRKKKANIYNTQMIFDE